MISDLKSNSYEGRLKEVGLTTLKERRRRGDLIETFKTMKGYNREDKTKWLEIIKENE